MSYPHQESTLRRLREQTRVTLETKQDADHNRLLDMWDRTKLRLRGEISNAYHQVSQAATGKWDRRGFLRVRSGLAMRLKAILEQFHSESVSLVKNSVKAIYNQSILRHAWMLDQVTPENQRVNLPHIPVLRESDIIRNPEEFDARWSNWMDAYNSALIQNLGMNALNEGSISDAADEVDATKINTPASTLIGALERIHDYEVMSAISEAAESISNLNDDAISEEVWRTRQDLRVCDDCDANDGMAVEEVGYPPAHPNCHCFTELVPTSFAELLRSGDEQDNALAAEMEQKGIAPNALVIRAPNGEIAAKAIVDFQPWVEDQERSISFGV